MFIKAKCSTVHNAKSLSPHGFTKCAQHQLQGKEWPAALPFAQSTERAGGTFCLLLTLGLQDDVADSQPLADVMEGLVPRIAPLVNVVVGARPDHVVQGIVAGAWTETRVAPLSKSERGRKASKSLQKSWDAGC